MISIVKFSSGNILIRKWYHRIYAVLDHSCVTKYETNMEVAGKKPIQLWECCLDKEAMYVIMPGKKHI
jgi:hypothetical protein